MTTSTDAILYYGYAPEWSPDDGTPWTNEDGEEEIDPDEWVASLAGKKSGIKIVYHCSGEHTMYGLAVKSSSTRARRGFPECVSPGDTVAYDHVLDKFIKKAGLDEDALGERGWWLVSYWG